MLDKEKVMASFDEKKKITNENGGEKIEENGETTEQSPLDLESFFISESKQKSCVSRKYDSKHVRLTHHKNGKRLVISKDLSNAVDLGSEVQINISKKESGILVKGNSEGFTLKEQKNTKVIYSSELTAELVEALNLRYTGISSKTFDNVIILDENTFFVRMNDNENNSRTEEYSDE